VLSSSTCLGCPSLPAGKVRACDRRFLALVRDLDETQVDDLARGLKLILAVGRQARRGA
jgi:hypothetical protein